MSKKIPLPEGYDGWLDFAVETFNVRQEEVNRALSGEIDPAWGQEMREAAREELRELRRLARRNSGI